ncbi:autophagy protein Apg17-domain-containing protein [Irpex rosettiformis]|uniref:Autophagy protein Apg17-domain-containing protein n=1 Tax=Irpex rosettiformis TaxID=378272 RepID=A0ACB8TZM5_9APHY|nr:autophagy protein Apg17-domain-containing protein [Irpex rosettiformis]
MASTPTNEKFGPEQPHLVQLVLASKKALQHGEQLCSRARSISVESAQTALDVLALDAKVKWITNAVTEQLKLAASVAKMIESKRTVLEQEAKTWDTIRKQRTSALDAVLDSLGNQAVPPDFYLNSPVSSLFGSQRGSDDEREDNRPNGTMAGFQPGASPTETLRAVLRNGVVNGQRRARTNDRSTWKTLRDFVDEQAIEDMFDALELERNVLDDIMARTSDYPETLTGTISAIQNSLPLAISVPNMTEVFNSQETVSADMATHLSSLLQHYDQMVQALHDSEAGETFGQAEIQDMNRDTNELPAIIADLDRNINSISESHQRLISAKKSAQEQLEGQRRVLADLGELADIIADMLERQEIVEAECKEHLAQLEQRLTTVEELHHRYTSYQYSYNKLVVELVRRRKYMEAAMKIVQGMTKELKAMAEEEQQLRVVFNEAHGDYLPMDVCLSIANMPTRWQVMPESDQIEESALDIDTDILSEALSRISTAEGALNASQSL